MPLKKPTFVAYRAKDGWRWHLRARNGLIIAESGEAYTRRYGCMQAIDTVLEAIFYADIEVRGK